ncbi:hypothetical protein PanWU01x14_303120 [Parasponia andersonii]|uniref:Uncharacterized protein n=1 Tax=Parasponia andersonii TaxID=3476 RepID=A0A2P5AT06_PARAD|nr:hypothetical protein PanWU01x14_303120 [Parasponia andersonii]
MTLFAGRQKPHEKSSGEARLPNHSGRIFLLRKRSPLLMNITISNISPPHKSPLGVVARAHPCATTAFPAVVVVAARRHDIERVLAANAARRATILIRTRNRRMSRELGCSEKKRPRRSCFFYDGCPYGGLS